MAYHSEEGSSAVIRKNGDVETTGDLSTNVETTGGLSTNVERQVASAPSSF